MNGDWLDRAATVVDERLSRRRLVVAGLGILALGPLGTLARTARGAGAEPCGPVCLQRWNEYRVTGGKFVFGTGVAGLLTANPLLMSAAVGGGAAYAYELYHEHGKCYQPNCGGPPPPPPPPGSPPPPPPPPPPPHGEPEHPPNTKSKGPAKRKRKKPPAKKDPSKNSICVDLGCAAVGAACCPTSQGSFGYVCCNCCADSGDGCKAICG